MAGTVDSASGPAMTARDRVRVAVRVRPASLTEKCGMYKDMVKVVDGSMLVFDPDQTADGRCIARGSEGLGRRRIGLRRAKNLRYAYDQVFDADVGTEIVFEQTTRPLIEYVCAGYAGTVFAYGATGSGKSERTHRCP